MQNSPVKSSLEELAAKGCPPVIMIGMHRSGTSLVSRLACELGMHMGNDLNVHDESLSFKHINDHLLNDVGAHWAKLEPFIARLKHEDFVEQNALRVRQMLDNAASSFGEVGENQPWGWKDPRTTVTLPIWLKVFPQAKVLHIVRNGIDVALSLYRREPKRYFRRSDVERMFPPTLGRGYKLWARYVEMGLSFETDFLQQNQPINDSVADERWMTLRYEDLLAHPYEQVEALCKFMGLRGDIQQKQAIAARMVDRPTKASPLELKYVQLLKKTGGIDLKPMIDMGYEQP